MKGVRCISEQW